MVYVVSTATLPDADAIATLVNICYRGEEAKLGWTTEADLLDGQRTDVNEVIRLIETDVVRILKDSETDTIVACARLSRPGADDKVPRLYLGMLSVNPRLQNQGVAKTLLDDAYEFSKKEGYKGLTLTAINVRKELIAYYTRRGFVETDDPHEPFPYGQPRFGVPKVEGLAFVTMVKD